MYKTFITLFFVFIVPSLSVLLAVENQQEYRILPEDVIQVIVFGEPDLNMDAKVNRDGVISYPLLRQVKVVGLTLHEVEDKIRDLLEKDYLVNPHVTVMVKQYGSVYMMGQVSRVGPIQLMPNMTITQAFTAAGGFTKFAAPNRTRLVRVENGKRIITEVPVKDIMQDSDTSRDVLLRPNDVIVVPESFF